MKQQAVTFGNGKTIFREGEASKNAFTILEGEVVLTKSGTSGMVTLAVLKPGDLVGEMGLLDESPRSATAKAMGNVVLEPISREMFLKDVQENPKKAIAVMEKLVERLRKADDMLAQGGFNPSNKTRPQGAAAGAGAQRAPAPRPAAKKPGLLARLLGRGTPTPSPRTAPVEVLVPPFVGDKDGSQSKRVIKAFEEVPGVRVKGYAKTPFEPKMAEDSAGLSRLKSAGRKIMNETGTDMLIIGSVSEAGDALSLRFVNIVEEDDDRLGSFGATTAFALPANFEGELNDLFITVAMAALIPRTDNQVKLLRAFLPGALDKAKRAGRKPPLDLSKNDQAAVQAGFASAAAFVGHLSGDQRWLDEAKTAYQASVRTLARSSGKLDWAMVHFQLGKVLQALAEKATSLSSLAEAEDAFNAALTVLTKENFPILWATIQNRLGQLRYKMDVRSGNKGEGSEPNNLKDATAAYQNALQVFTMAETPQKWAEVKHNLAQSLQILGGHAHSVPLLEKAAQACLDALEVRVRDRFPLPWASTMNSLGSALFLIGRQAEEPGTYLKEAEDAFAGALEVYKAHNAINLAKIALRNLKRVRAVIAGQAGPQNQKKPLGKFSWDDEENEAAGEAKS